MWERLAGLLAGSPTLPERGGVGLGVGFHGGRFGSSLWMSRHKRHHCVGEKLQAPRGSSRRVPDPAGRCGGWDWGGLHVSFHGGLFGTSRRRRSRWCVVEARVVQKYNMKLEEYTKVCSIVATLECGRDSRVLRVVSPGPRSENGNAVWETDSFCRHHRSRLGSY